MSSGNPLPTGSHNFKSVTPQGQNLSVVDLSKVPGHLQRFDVAPSGCWIWHSRSKQTGYATATSYKGKKGSPYRLLYELLVGPIPPGYDLDHLCDSGRLGCANPFHCKPATRQENMNRTPTTIPGKHVRKTHCPQGHPYSGDNLLIETYRGTTERHCKTCKAARTKAWMDRDRDAYRAHQRKKYAENREKILAQKQAWRDRKRAQKDDRK